jgi:hypothetical protein
MFLSALARAAEIPSNDGRASLRPMVPDFTIVNRKLQFVAQGLLI